MRNAKKKVAALAATVAAIGGLYVAAPAAAHATSTSRTTSAVLSPASFGRGAMFNIKGKCLDGGGGWLSAWPCNGTPAQIWTNISNDSRYVQFQDGLGKCIDSGQSSSLFSCNGGDYQKFTKKWVGGPIDGRFYAVFQNVHNPHLCIDAGPSGTGLWACADLETNQWWSWD